jgi:hypothetical protein
MISRKWAHVAHEAAELAAEVRREPLDQTARVASLEKRRRKQDEPARRAYANQSLALRFFIQFVGYDLSVADTLRAAIEAAAGLDHAITRADWEMGLYLRGDSHMEAERLRRLPAHHTEKRTLARAWTRAYAEYKAEEKRTGIVALRRIEGSQNFKTGQRKASQIHALCAQDIAEIASAAMKIHGKRFERFAQAAAAHVAILRDDETRKAHTKEDAEPKPARIKQPDTPALAVVRFLKRVEKAVDELMRDVPPELQAEARAHAESLLAQKFDGDEDTQDGEQVAAPVAPDLRINRWTKTDDPARAGEIECTNTENAEANKNAGAEGGLVDNLSPNAPPNLPPPIAYQTYRKALTFFLDEKQRAGMSLDEAVALFEAEIGDEEAWTERMNSYSRPFSHTCPSPDVDPDLIAERVAVMCEGSDVSETEAAGVARRELCETCHEVERLTRSQVTELEYAPGKYM